MNTVNDFIKSMVKVEFIEQSNCYGHYPFQLFSESKDGKSELSALALGGNVKSCFETFSEYKKSGSTRIYMSLDYPSGDDIAYDFVCVFQYENDLINLLAIPYDSDGNVLDTINNSSLLTKIKLELMHYIS